MSFQNVNLKQTVGAVKHSKPWTISLKGLLPVVGRGQLGKDSRLTGSFPGFAPFLLIIPSFAERDPTLVNKNEVCWAQDTHRTLLEVSTLHEKNMGKYFQIPS